MPRSVTSGVLRDGMRWTTMGGSMAVVCGGGDMKSFRVEHLFKSSGMLIRELAFGLGL